MNISGIMAESTEVINHSSNVLISRPTD